MARRRARWRRNVGRGLTRLLGPALAGALVVALLVGGVADIGRASGGFRSTVDRGFAALLATVAARSTATGAQVRVVVPSSPGYSRPTLFADLAHLRADTAAEQQALATAVPPDPAGTWATGCMAALADRASGTAALVAAVEGLLGGPAGESPPPADPVGAVDRAESQLVQADTSWAGCRQAARRTPARVQVPASQWWPPGDAPSPAPALVAALQDASTLRPQHQLAVVVVTTDPAALSGGAAGTASLPPTASVTVHAVVTDQGNVDEPGVRVIVTMEPAGGGVGPTKAATVDLLAGRSAAVVVGPFPVHQGDSYQLVVIATPTAQVGAASSALQLSIVSVPATTTTTTTTTTVPPRHRG